ncbi:hypothetical protein NCS52_00008300 [Fusarium sp. LHS14.1]|nr:hypothetical protein NCS52_00008300 [Fusarium sp. LHS14.1]
MDECVRLEEALQAEEERSPRRRPARRSSGWPFSFEDFGRTDEIRLPPVSPGLAALSPGPPARSPRRRETNPSSPRTETTSREERRTIYSTHSTSKHRDKRTEVTPQSPTLPRAFSLTDLGDSQDSRNSHRRYNSSISPRTRNNAPQNREEERSIRPENVTPAGSGTPRAASKPRLLQIPELVAILRHEETAGPLIESLPQKIGSLGITFKAVCKAWAPVKLNTTPPQHRILVMLEIDTVFPTICYLNIYQVRAKFSYKADYTGPGPRIAKRAQNPLNKGDPGTRGEKELIMDEISAESKFTLEQKDFKSGEIVIHVALLLEQDQQNATKSFHAGFKFFVSGSALYRMHEQGGEEEDVELFFEPGKLGEHREHLVPKDLDLLKLLQSWVRSGRPGSAL